MNISKRVFGTSLFIVGILLTLLFTNASEITNACILTCSVTICGAVLIAGSTDKPKGKDE